MSTEINTLKLIETDSQFLEKVANVVSVDGVDWYCMPFWYKKLRDGIYVEYTFDKIPESLKKQIVENREKNKQS